MTKRHNKKVASRIAEQQTAELTRVAREVVFNDAARLFLGQVKTRNADGTVHIRRPEETDPNGAPSPVIWHRSPLVDEWVWCVDLGVSGVIVLGGPLDAIYANFLRIDGGTLTGGGHISDPVNPTAADHLARKGYVDGRTTVAVGSGLSLLSTWVETQAVQIVRHDASGWCSIRGRVNNPNASGGAVIPADTDIMQIPAGFRPNRFMRWITGVQEGGTNVDVALANQSIIRYDSSGTHQFNLWCQPSTGGQSTRILDGINYIAEA